MTDQAEKKHSAFWGVMVIAGTVIGGGMFALPVDLAGAWFFWGAFILIIAWFSMLHSGLLLLEANLNYPVGSSFNTITKDLIKPYQLYIRPGASRKDLHDADVQQKPYARGISGSGYGGHSKGQRA